MKKKELTEYERLRTLWHKNLEDMTEEEIDLIRRNSDMGDPDAWNCTNYICNHCGNYGGSWLCDYCTPDEMVEAKATGKCQYFEELPEDYQSQN